jgi:hypothetical protein
MSTPNIERSAQPQIVAEHLVAALRNVISRHQEQANYAVDTGLHAELLTAEVAHHLSVARSALHPRRPLHRENDIASLGPQRYTIVDASDPDPTGAPTPAHPGTVCWGQSPGRGLP